MRFEHEKFSRFKSQFTPIKEFYYWMQYPHHLESRQELKVTIYCSFDFSTFPFDSHECNLSYGMNLFSATYIHMMNLTVVHKKKQTVIGEPPLLGT